MQCGNTQKNYRQSQWLIKILEVFAPHLDKYLFIFISLIITKSLQDPTKAEHNCVFSSLNNKQTRTFHVPISCEWKPALPSSISGFSAWGPGTCQMYEFLKQPPCSAIIHKGKSWSLLLLWNIWKHIATGGRCFLCVDIYFFFCNFVFITHLLVFVSSH